MKRNFIAQFIHFEVLVVLRAVRCCHGEEMDPFCWPMLAAGIAVLGASHRFAEHTSQMQWFCWDSESCSGSYGQETTKEWLWLLWCKFGFGKCFGASFPSNHWAGCHKIHFWSYLFKDICIVNKFKGWLFPLSVRQVCCPIRYRDTISLWEKSVCILPLRKDPDSNIKFPPLYHTCRYDLHLFVWPWRIWDLEHGTSSDILATAIAE